VVAHDGVGEEVDSKELGEQDQSIFEPLAAMTKILASIVIFTAEKCAPHATGYAVIVACVF